MAKRKQFRIREKIYRWIFIFTDFYKQIKNIVSGISIFLFLVSAVFFVVLLTLHIGTDQPEKALLAIYRFYRYILLAQIISKVLHIIVRKHKKHIIIHALELIFVVSGIIVLWFYYRPHHFYEGFIFFLSHPLLLLATIVMLIISSVYLITDYITSLNISPALLFANSFLFLIFLGAGLLMLPKATYQSISFTEALFTSTSAVCVTGLIIVDTATVFTPLGKGIILMLIQIGGLGIMAFTGLFAYLFQGTASLKDRLVLKEMFAADQLSGMFQLIFKIVFITLLAETIGAICIFYSLEGSFDFRIKFAIFHSISAFCNAGFSTLSDGLASNAIKLNQMLQLSIIFLIIFGGIGFPVLLNFYIFIKQTIKKIWKRLLRKPAVSKPLIISLSTKISVVTTCCLLLLGTIFYFFMEKNNSGNIGQHLIASLFGSVSARTAGFNVVDISIWSSPTILMMILLMWIGASPGSTGGGIKTSTIGLAFLAAINVCRGKTKLEIGNREIGNQTLIRVLTVIILSIAFIFIASILLMIFEPNKNPIHLIFETVSAFATVGLSVVNTATLSTSSKYVIIVLMFVGRIGPITLLSAILGQQKKRLYELPEENIVIN